MSAAHSQGLLEVHNPHGSEISSNWIVRNKDRNFVAYFPVLIASARERQAADVRRLVACWNSCDGIQTELLEQIPGIAGATVPYRVLRAEHAALLEFARATLGLSATLGHPEATAADEHKAEARYDAALPAARALAYPPAQAKLPAAAIAIGAALDPESLEQGEPG